ncbi:MAG: hypothetical protein KF778_00825 [Rhodocyclaceae bacterium]|nr:hypothetical protein [Rhodocyclaceae bacterium]
MGKLTVSSYIGQPLRAEVELNATSEELGSLTARVAPQSAFRQANVDYVAILSSLRMVVDRSGPRPVVRLSSVRPINEPFLDLLIELNWANGRLVREYTMLIDPAERTQPEAAAPVLAEPRGGSRARAEAPPAAKAAPAGGGTTRVVKSGDTLGRIAAEVRPEGVTLEQMLVALFRANPDAFDGKNMNRLRAGAILQVPESTDVQGIGSGDAHRVVVAQTSDFNAYRQRLAGSVESAPGAPEEAAVQESGGKITPKVEERAGAGASGPKDQVRVSKSAGGKGSEAAAGRVAALEEDAIAKDKALQEANSRVAELERNVRDLQSLLELKNKKLAEVQSASAPAGKAPTLPPPVAAEPKPAPAEAKPAAAETKVAKAEPPPVVVPPPAQKVEPKPAPETKAEAKPEAPPAEVKPAPAVAAKAPEVKAPEPKPAEPKPAEPKKKLVVVQPPPEPQGFLAELMENPLLLGALGGVLLGGVGYLAYKRKRAAAPADAPSQAAPSTTSAMVATSELSAASGFGQPGGQSVDTNASSLQTDFSQSSLSAIDADEGVDPVAEADVYMAYGRDAQAEEILLEALKAEPSRHAIHLKLLEIYAQRKNAKQFETVASELYAQTGGIGTDWEKAASMGRKVDPANPLYGGAAAPLQAEDTIKTIVQAAPVPIATAAGAAAVAATDKTVVLEQSPLDTPKLRDTWTMPGELGQVAAAEEKLRPQAAAAIADEAPFLEATQINRVSNNSLDFDLDLPDEAPALAASGPAATLTPDVPASEADNSVDFDLGLDFGSAPQASDPARTAVLEKGIADKADLPFDLLLDESDAGSAATRDKTDVLSLDRSDDGNMLDFDLGGEPLPDISQAPPSIDLSDISLDLGALDVPPTPSTPKAAASADADVTAAMLATSPVPINLLQDVESSDATAEVDTKLDLARAYEDMGDKEGARELLQEVLKEGSAAQQDLARDMLKRLS